METYAKIKIYYESMGVIIMSNTSFNIEIKFNKKVILN